MGEKLQFTELDQYLFGQGTHYDIYRKLGAHPTIQRRKKGIFCCVGTKCQISFCCWRV